MKKLFTLMTLAFAFTLNAQTYVPFPASNAMWTQREGNGDTTPSYFCYGLTTEDTTLNIVSYHKLFKSSDTIFNASECIGGLREDAQKRVFFYDFGTGQERLVYDFSVQPGDTIVLAGPEGIVDHIDSVNINGNYRRRINFKMLNGSTWSAGAWIDGIGNSSLGGLLGSPMAQPTCDCADNTICFRQNNNWLYHNPLYSAMGCLDGVLDVAKVKTNNLAISLYPNPVNATSTLHIDGAVKGSIRIYSITGVLLHTYPLGSDISISRDGYPSGMYLYRLNDEAGSTASGKFEVE